MKFKPLSIILWIAVTLWFLALLGGAESAVTTASSAKISYDGLLGKLSAGAIAAGTIQEETIEGTRTDGSSFESYNPVHKVGIIPRGRALGVPCSCRGATAIA